MTLTSASGGCQCGAVRYRAQLNAESAHICHCRMCQKAVGGPFAALVSGPLEGIVWTRGQPAVFHSSDPVERGFCAACGTPLTYRYLAGRNLNVTIGSLDDPSRFPPQHQFGCEGRIGWFATVHAVQDEPPTEVTMAGVVADIAASNHQHPDHDTETWPLSPPLKGQT